MTVAVFDYIGTGLIINVNGGIYSLKNRGKNETFKTPAEYGLNSEKFTIKTFDHFQMKCLLVKSNTPEQKGTIILLHGIRSRKEHYLQLAKQLADSSYNSVLVDLRAHGESTGKYCTYGFKEKQDIKRLAKELTQRKDISKNIGIWGQSLGGAVALQSMGISHDIKFGIIESTFADFNDIVHDYFNYYLGFDIPVISDHLIQKCKNIAQFNPDDVKPYQYCEKITQPIIIAHGDCDDRIKIDYGRKNFAHLKSTDKEFIEVKNATHVNVWSVGGDEYMRKVFAFIERQSSGGN